MTVLRLFLFLAFSFSSLIVSAQQLDLANIFTDNMVLQRQKEVTVWGKATPRHKIQLRIGDKNLFTKASKNGTWEINIPPHPAGGSYTLTVNDLKSQESITLNNLTFGDVWICGGQSNMEWFVENSKDAEVEIETASHPQIRLLTIPRTMANLPKNDIEGLEWKICSPESIAQFSAVAYYFGRNLKDSLQIPIGLISDNWGGTVAEAWTSPEALIDLPTYKTQLEKLKTLDLDKEAKSGDDEFNAWLDEFTNLDAGMENSQPKWHQLEHYNDWKGMTLPGIWESSGDPELRNADGIVWFQKHITLSADQAASATEISTGPIDDSDKIWINGQLVGETFNFYNKDRNYSIPKGVLKAGKNSIVIRVEDYIGGGGPYGDAFKYFIKTKSEKISIAGLWKYKAGFITTKPMPKNAFGPNAYPSMLYNGMIAPIKKIALKGVIWYQGESNAYRAVEYRNIFRKLILDWRKQFNYVEMPFLFVQLANFGAPSATPGDSQWAELREAQASVLDLPNTGMITAIDIGQANSIHPTNKQEVGRRLALEAFRLVYQLPGATPQGATYKESHFNEDYVVIHFNTHGRALTTKDKYGYVRGFIISGADHKFYWAKAEIVDKDKVKVWSNHVKAPKAVRYAWDDNPQPADLFDSDGWPVLPFRTDNWTLSTDGINRN